MCMCTRAGVVWYLLEKWWYALGQLWEGFLPGSNGPYTSAVPYSIQGKRNGGGSAQW